MKNLLILGAGGFGRTAAELARCTGQFGKIRFLDDASREEDVVGTLAEYRAFAGEYPCAAVAIGNNAVRLQWVRTLRQAGFELPVLVHPRAWVSPSATVGAGSFVLPGAVINTGVSAGAGCIVNCNAVLDHDCRLEDGVHACLGCIVKAGAVISSGQKVEAGEVVHSPWETK